MKERSLPGNKLCCLMIIGLLATGICTAEVPNLLGKWTGSWSGYDNGKGYTAFGEGGNLNFTFAEQRGRIFNGNLTVHLKDGTELNEEFAGAIGLDNKTLNIAEFDNGYALGTVISNDEMAIIYLADGQNSSVAIDELHRVAI